MGFIMCFKGFLPGVDIIHGPCQWDTGTLQGSHACSQFKVLKAFNKVLAGIFAPACKELGTGSLNGIEGFEGVVADQAHIFLLQGLCSLFFNKADHVSSVAASLLRGSGQE